MWDIITRVVVIMLGMYLITAGVRDIYTVWKYKYEERRVARMKAAGDDTLKRAMPNLWEAITSLQHNNPQTSKEIAKELITNFEKRTKEQDKR